jgi:O-antigen/teichoic acid export membrane protein
LPEAGTALPCPQKDRQLSLARHTVYNLAGQLLPLVLSLLTIPLYLRLIGEARFGVLALVWLFFGYMGLFDLGVGQATARQLSQTDSASPAAKSRILWTALLISLGLGLVGALVAGTAGAWFFAHHAAIEDEVRVELLAALPWAVMVVPAVALAGVLNGALQARSAFGEINVIGVVTNALVLLAPLTVAATAGANLSGLVAAVATARLLVLLLLFYRCGRQDLAAASISLDRQTALRLLSFGGWATVSAGISPLLVVLDRFLIGAHLGAKAVSHYVIPFQLAERTTTLSSALGYALFPRFAACTLEADRQQLAMHGLRVLAMWTSPFVAVGLLLAGPFLAWWISPELALQSTLVAQVLCVAFWISSLAMVPYTKLLATGRPDLVAKSHMVQLLPYVALLYAALHTWGLVGAAFAFAARVAVDFLLLSHWAGTLKVTCKLLAIPATLVVVTLGVATHAGLAEDWRWASGLALACTLALWSLAQMRQPIPFSGRSHL